MVSINDMIDLLFTYLIIEMQMMLFMLEMDTTMMVINCALNFLVEEVEALEEVVIEEAIVGTDDLALQQDDHNTEFQ